MNKKFRNALMYICFLLLIFGIVFLSGGIGNMNRSKQTPIPLEELTPDDLSKNIVVEGDIIYNYGAFMEEYTTNYGVKTGSSTYTYLIDLGDYGYIGVKTQNSQTSTLLEQQSDDTYAYFYEEGAGAPSPIHIKGRLRKLDDESYGFMKEALEYMGYSTREAELYGYAYYIETESYDNYAGTIKIGAIATGLGLILLIIIIISIIKSKKNQMAVPPTYAPQGDVPPMNDLSSTSSEFTEK